MTSSPSFPEPGRAPASNLRLVCHPATPCTLSIALSCTVWTDAGQRPHLQLRYELVGNLSDLRLPAPVPEGTADGLWQHTCFEAFASPAGGSAYQEFNFSPSGQWASYRFSAERVRHFAAEVGQRLGPRTQRPRLQVQRHTDRLVLQASLVPEALTGVSNNGVLRLGLSAVVEDSAGRLSYWALHHPGTQPDFHHPAGFVHALPWPPLP